MSSHVDQLGRHGNTAHRGFHNEIRSGHEGDNRAVVIGVDVGVEHASCFDRLDRLRQPRYHVRLAAFAEVWYTLDQTGRFVILNFQFEVLNFELGTLFFVLYSSALRLIDY
jgi:hypothetical protein